MKKALALICIISIFCTLAIPAYACWAWGFESVDELINGKESENAPGADIIITGIVIAAEHTELARTPSLEFMSPVTVASVRVTEVIKGDVSVGDIIKTVSTGYDWSLVELNEGDIITESSVDGPFLSLEQDFLLFLWESAYGENNHGNYGFSGANQGAFILSGERVEYGEYMGINSLDSVRSAARRSNDSNPTTGVMLSRKQEKAALKAAFFITNQNTFRIQQGAALSCSAPRPVCVF
ncbi:MAG: hypothetical protein FWD48_06505 [Oscillospiraceae bacterium]|nr:hypothetical protein [Oscillospiraceae bacterium]